MPGASASYAAAAAADALPQPADRRLPPFRAIPKLDGLLSPDGYAELAYDIASPARGLALEALARAGVDPGELEAMA